MLAVMGSRQMEEINYLYFENKRVPPLALLVSGGRLSEASVPRIERFIEENLKGKANFHKILILEAEGGSHTSDAARARIELRPLTDAQQQDALFQQYDERNIDKVGSSFRLPRLLRGDSRDFNRAVADAQLRFDHVLNKRLLGDLGIRFWRFRSQTPVTRDPERMTDMVEKLVRVGVLTPEEGRQLASDIFNREFATLTADWVKRPITLTLAGIQVHGGETPSKPPEETLVDETKRRMALAREAFERPDPPRIVVPAGEWGQWFTDGGRVAEGPR
jgi:capsid portal protein